jgi:hypothetical protein
MDTNDGPFIGGPVVSYLRIQLNPCRIVSVPYLRIDQGSGSVRYGRASLPSLLLFSSAKANDGRPAWGVMLSETETRDLCLRLLALWLIPSRGGVWTQNTWKSDCSGHSVRLVWVDYHGKSVVYRSVGLDTYNTNHSLEQ